MLPRCLRRAGRSWAAWSGSARWRTRIWHRLLQRALEGPGEISVSCVWSSCWTLACSLCRDVPHVRCRQSRPLHCLACPAEGGVGVCQHILEFSDITPSQHTHVVGLLVRILLEDDADRSVRIDLLVVVWSL